MEFVVAELYGGAMQMRVPCSFFNVSEIRQIPDHQEVFVDRVIPEWSCIVEFLEYQSSQADDNIARYLFTDLCEENGVEGASDMSIVSSSVLDLAQKPNFVEFHASIIYGTQRVCKFRESERKLVHTWLGVVRLPKVNCELAVSFNIPQDASGVTIDFLSTVHSIFAHVFSSLQINDWGLFPEP
eukprot:TRINITY_DN10422_c0_g1_i1.p1 TRINITY_DN10422_c0_g1~~TRINITY_DN10422_c0_g1_i1.p1  ORF type:complete len:184 (-),score=30.67 TRINITY_DN10422_c0_g1_i1:94-645(-)